jgi:hypothetical protein
MSTTLKNTGLPGERWLARLQPIDVSESTFREGIVKLVDFDPTTQVWSVEGEESGAPKEVEAKNLIERLV